MEISWSVPQEWWPLCKYLFKAITVKHPGWKTAVSFYHFFYCVCTVQLTENCLYWSFCGAMSLFLCLVLPLFLAVLRIRDISVRIRILWSAPLSNGSGCGSGRPKNIRMWIRNTDKKSQRSHKTVKIKVFLTIFAWWWKDPEPDPYLLLTDPDADPGGPRNIRILWIRIHNTAF